MEKPYGLSELQELAVKLAPGVVSGQDLAVLVQVPEQGLLHFGMNNGQVLLGAELAEVTRGQHPEKLGGVHGLHVAVLGEALSPELVRVDQRREASVHVERLVVEALEYLA